MPSNHSVQLLAHFLRISKNYFLDIRRKLPRAHHEEVAVYRAPPHPAPSIQPAMGGASPLIEF